MTDNADGPFQMDEDISGLPNNVSKDDPGYNEIQISKLTQSGTILDNDTPLRSKLNQLKLEEKENNATTIEEEEEKNYDEDVDDKLDVNLQKLQLEYEEQQRQHKKTIETADIIEQDKQYDLDFDVDDQPLTPPENFALVIDQSIEVLFLNLPIFHF